MLIRAYGQFWNPDIVDWGKQGPGNKGTMLGSGKWGSNTVNIDSWEQHGIYILHDDFKCVYVGQTCGQFLGKRLRDHLTDRFAGRWDMFSWYGIDSVKKSGKLRRAGARQVPPDELIRTIEALGILIADPPLNRKRESLKKAILVEQTKSPHPHTIRHYLQELLDTARDIQSKV
ncbi:MAG TPA: GIY-YIG nuclease family protein [Verrucomicrobiae bacterium]